MKKNKNIRLLLLYIICLFKILCTFIHFQDLTAPYLSMLQDLSLYPSIISIPGLFAFMWNENVAMLCMVSLIVVITTWVLALPASFLGFKFKLFRKISVALIIFATGIDLIVSLVASAIEIKIICGLVNAFILAFAISCLIDVLQRSTPQKDDLCDMSAKV